MADTNRDDRARDVKRHDEEILAINEAGIVRRILATGIIGGLGAILVYISIVQPPAVLGWRFFLFGFGLFSIWGAERLWRATALRLELTREVLRDSSGTIVTRIEDIASIDRGMFAFKPSNGFVLRLRSVQPGGWRPGLWWRLRARVGVGGVTAGAPGKFMAETIQGLLALRDQ